MKSNRKFIFTVSRYKCAKNFFGPNNSHSRNQYYHTDSFLGMKEIYYLYFLKFEVGSE